jgi:hypothetical protein
MAEDAALPEIDARDALYVAIGAAVLGFQRLMVARRRWLETSGELGEQAARTGAAALDVAEMLLPEPARLQFAETRRTAAWTYRTMLGRGPDGPDSR